MLMLMLEHLLFLQLGGPEINPTNSSGKPSRPAEVSYSRLV